MNFLRKFIPRSFINWFSQKKKPSISEITRVLNKRLFDDVSSLRKRRSALDDLFSKEDLSIGDLISILQRSPLSDEEIKRVCEQIGEKSKLLEEDSSALLIFCQLWNYLIEKSLQNNPADQISLLKVLMEMGQFAYLLLKNSNKHMLLGDQRYLDNLNRLARFLSDNLRDSDMLMSFINSEDLSDETHDHALDMLFSTEKSEKYFLCLMIFSSKRIALRTYSKYNIRDVRHLNFLLTYCVENNSAVAEDIKNVFGTYLLLNANQIEEEELRTHVLSRHELISNMAFKKITAISTLELESLLICTALVHKSTLEQIAHLALDRSDLISLNSVVFIMLNFKDDLNQRAFEIFKSRNYQKSEISDIICHGQYDHLESEQIEFINSIFEN